MDLLSILLQCGAFIFVLIATFGSGIWKNLQFNEKYHRISAAGLIGLIFFEASLIGMLIDLGSINVSFMQLIFTSGIIGIITFLFVLLLLPVFLWIYRVFK